MFYRDLLLRGLEQKIIFYLYIFFYGDKRNMPPCFKRPPTHNNKSHEPELTNPLSVVSSAP